MFIYKIVNEINDKVYVGQTVKTLEDRWRGHVRKSTNTETNRPLYNAMRKYGVEHFHIVMIEQLPNDTTQDILNEREIYWIAKLSCLAPSGYNLTTGGDGRFHLSNETKRKISESNMGREVSEETRKKISETLTGTTHLISEETKRKISEANTGFIPSEETRKKISESHKNNSEAIEKFKKNRCANAFEGHHHSDATKQKLSLAFKGKSNIKICKPVLNIETGVIYPSRNQAAIDNNVSKNVMHKLIHKGIKFRYLYQPIIPTTPIQTVEQEEKCPLPIPKRKKKPGLLKSMMSQMIPATTSPTSPIYLLAGVSGSGKTWVANQLLDKFTLLHRDGKEKKHLWEYLNKEVYNDKPILICLPVAATTVKKNLTLLGYTSYIVQVIEPNTVIMERRKERTTTPSDRIDSQHPIKDALFCGNSYECLSFLSSL